MLILKIIFKNYIILIYFKTKIILKNNYHNIKITFTVYEFLARVRFSIRLMTTFIYFY